MRKPTIHFSRTELEHLFRAWVALSLAFGILLNGGSVFSVNIAYTFVLSALTVGIAFLLHELGHKFVAQNFGYISEFRAFDKGLILAVVMSFFGFIFAAPGAVMIQARHINNRRRGLISAAGPLVNIILGVFFLGLKMLNIHAFVNNIAYYGILINAWLALFNMLPFGPLDGKKILRWNRLVYGAMVLASVGILFLNS